MALNLIPRYRKYIEIPIWLLIASAFLLVNLTNFPLMITARPFVNSILLVTALYTLIYYHIVVPKFENEKLILKAEIEKTKNLQEREKIIFQSIRDLIIALDRTGKVLMINQGFLEEAGSDKSTSINVHYKDLFSIYKVDHLGHYTAEKDLLLTPEYQFYYTINEKPKKEENMILVPKQTNKEIPVEATISPLKSRNTDEKVPEGVVAVIRDVTEKRELERMQLDFVSMAAHEIRTPITTIRGYLNALKEEAWGIFNEDQKRFIERAYIASTQLATLMENLLSVSRIEKGTYTLALKEIHWAELLEQKIEEFQAQAQEHNLELVWHKPKTDLPKVFVDPLRIVEVINNLVDNAINYTPSGKVEITVEYDQENEMVITHVIDTGQGIPETALSHIFEKFFRVTGILEQGSKGTGLGLYISKQIVELHHGKIWVESKLDQGSKFSFSIPTIYKKTKQDEYQIKLV